MEKTKLKVTTQVTGHDCQMLQRSLEAAMYIEKEAFYQKLSNKRFNLKEVRVLVEDLNCECNDMFSKDYQININTLISFGKSWEILENHLSAITMIAETMIPAMCQYQADFFNLWVREVSE